MTEEITTNDKNVENLTAPEFLPLFLTDDAVLFPGTAFPLAVTDKKMVNMVNEVLEKDQKLLAVSLKKLGPDGKTRIEEPYQIGCSCTITKMLRIPDGSLRLIVQGSRRIKIEEIIKGDRDYSKVRFSIMRSEPGDKMKTEALMRNIKNDFGEVINAAPYLPDEMKVYLLNISDPNFLADFISTNINVKPDERQDLLATVNIEQRLRKVSGSVSRELELLKLGNKIQTEVSGTIEKNQREYFLREQMKAIKKELGEDEDGAEIKALKKKLDELDAPEEVLKAAKSQIEKLDRISPNSPEHSVTRNYLDWIFDLPWRISSEDTIDIESARKILDRDHYGLQDVKDRIIEFLAVKKLRGAGATSIISFVGPPGVGKTSIGKSIASAMGRKFVRMSLGGLRDEAEIRGHRRTYIGALPGRIIQNIKRAGTNNPVFMLDEIDKLGSDFRGDPSSAMLEVLDPEQNFSFQDNYLELDFDLSKVMFITTANYLETIPPPLRDRMDIINLPGYITPEKVEIAKRYLVPRQIEENGLKNSQVKFTDTALEHIIIHYTRESGVRTLERTIGKVCRKIAVKIASGEEEKHSISVNNYEDYLGPRKIHSALESRSPRIGVANGLAWTQVGGVMLYIEAIDMPGQGRIKITGQLGEVMKESAEIAMSLLRDRAEKFKISQDYFKNNDFHIHIPEGATPKDGPSAGITLTTAMASLFTNKPVRHDLAMTGEITLQGRVLPIGGLREKSVAAARAQMKTIICPKENQPDLVDIPDIVKDKLEFKFVEKIDEVLRLALLPKKK